MKTVPRLIQVVPGLDEGVSQLSIGERAKVTNKVYTRAKILTGASSLRVEGFADRPA